MDLIFHKPAFRKLRSHVSLPPIDSKKNLKSQTIYQLKKTKPQFCQNLYQNKLKKAITMNTYQTQNNITAQSYAIFNQKLEIIQGIHQNKTKPIASLTKIMTMLIVINQCKRMSIAHSQILVRASAKATNIKGTIAEIQPKQWIKVSDLLYALMLPSGNDAALILAENIGAYIYYDKKGEKQIIKTIKNMDLTNDTFARKFYLESFVSAMNSMAKDLGMENTKFSNPHGLDDPKNYSTIKDLAILLRATYYDKQCLQIMSTKIYKAKVWLRPNQKEQYRQIQWINTHKLLQHQDVICGKTGQTFEAGNCLATVARHKNNIFFIIVLGSKTRQDRFIDTKQILQIAKNKEIS